MNRNYKVFRHICTHLTLAAGIFFLLISFVFIIEPSGQIIEFSNLLVLLQQTFNYFGWFRSLFFPGIVCLALVGAPHMIAGLLFLARIPSAIKVSRIASVIFFISSLLGTFVFQDNWMTWLFLLFSLVEFVFSQLCLVFYHRYSFYFNVEDYRDINKNNKNMLVLYYALNNYTRKYAYEVANQNRCSIYEITTVNNYQSNIGWLEVVIKTIKGENIQTNPANIDFNEYKHIYLITESYHGKIISPVLDFCIRDLNTSSIEYDIIRFSPIRYHFNIETLDKAVDSVAKQVQLTFISYGKVKSQNPLVKNKST